MHDTALPTATAPPSAAPGRWLLAGISFAGMFIGGLILSMVLGSRTFPSPYETQAAITGYFAASGSAVLGLGLLHTLAAIPLTIFTTALARALPDALPRMVVQHAGVIAAVFLLISAMCDIALVSGGGLTGEALRALHLLTFLSGGSIHVLFLGILVGAGTIGLAGAAPRALTLLGAISGVVSLASVASLIATPVAFLLPLGRFTALAWIIAAAIWLARRRST
ncbi:hypothetical protein ACIBO5_56145 [Nonomuraea angiospora]|uniref:hypothetical protein n=1 Tax=Nonomuraea angiospora TaxID=46172 RepID=UPI0029B74F65|nr:hypothetical protein [Nonomuraea angiospora]MDX3101509.1 hypothetical protein [Nonomuraea angiospora]